MEYNNTEYYKWLSLLGPGDHLKEDIVHSDDLDPAVIMEKLQTTQRKNIANIEMLQNIKNMIATPGFKRIEEVMLKRVKAIETNWIWAAIVEGDMKKIMALHAEHLGIIDFFAKIDVTDTHILFHTRQKMIFATIIDAKPQSHAEYQPLYDTLTRQKESE